MKKNRICFLFVVIFLIPITSAFSLGNFSLGNLSSGIDEVYAPKENLKGWVNISFENEKTDSLISSSFNGIIKLIDFLNNNLASYTCSPADCRDDYLTNNPEQTKSFSIKNEKKILAFVLNGYITQILGLSLNLSIANNPSCINPIEIDILDDDSIEFISRNVGNNYVCTYKEGTGCFNPNESLSEVYIGKTPYCEKITLTQSEKFQLGAWVKKSNDYPEDKLKMALYNLYGEELKFCNLPEPSSAGTKIFCEINYVNKKIQEYYVCIKAETQSITKYLTKKEDVNSCGFYSFPGEQKKYHDYYIFAKAAQFENTGNFPVNQQEYEQQGNSGDFSEYVAAYIEERYEKNCSNGCKIPIKFKAYGNLDIKISNLKLEYSTSGGIQTPETKIYNAERQAALLNTEFLKLDLEFLNISVPKDYGNHTLKLYLNDKEILGLGKEIKVEKVPIIESVFPEIVSAALPTKFFVSVSSVAGRNISKYEWDFGDNSSLETKQNQAVHAYASIGKYSLKIKAVDSEGFSSKKEFTIIAENPKYSANQTIKKYNERLNNLSFQLANFDAWEKTIVEKKIELESLNNKLDELEKKFLAPNEDYVVIMSELAKMEIPYKISKTETKEIPFFADFNEIELSYLKELGAGDYNESKEEEYKKAIVAWIENNLKSKLEFKHILASYDTGEESLFGIFNLEISGFNKELYVVIEKKEIVFEKEQKTKEFPDATGIILSDKKIKFAISEAKMPVIYLSPKFSELKIEMIEPCNFNGKCEKELGENWRNCRADCKPWLWVVVLMVVIIAFGLLSYVFMQWWYKFRYESYLFKNRNDIYNIIQFIKNARSQGMNDSLIKKKLKEAGWKGEQISYVFKKLEGKAIMPFDSIKNPFRFFGPRKQSFLGF